MSEKNIKTLETLAAIATIFATCIAAIALIPSFGQWLSPRSLINTTESPDISQQKRTFDILWTDHCDPRISDDYCNDVSRLSTLDEFYAVIDSVNATITYKIPDSQQDLTSYSVVIVDFCSAGNDDSQIEVIKEYIQSGGSAFIMGDGGCKLGGHETSWLASQITEDFGVTFSDDNDFENVWADSIETHLVTESIEKIYVFGHSYLNVTYPSKAIVTANGKPIMAVYDGKGTFVAVAEVGFHWGASIQESERERGVASSDNFALWENAIEWLISRSQVKR